jgi:3-(3-hydroxy-phenyl)propionate hydroxylase
LLPDAAVGDAATATRAAARTSTTPMPAAFRFARDYELPQWPAAPKPAAEETHDVVIVGGGLAGLTLACDLAQRGVPAVVLDEDDTIGVRGASSRGICYAQKSLEIFERLGLYERIRDKGIGWSVGNTFSGHHKVWSFNLQTDSVSAQPPFINLQQFYLEWLLVDRIAELGQVQLRWKHRVTSIDPQADEVGVEVDTPAGPYRLHARWLIDATGANSPLRRQLGIDPHEARSADRWCITDVRFTKTLPNERWTWIDAPFNDDRAVWQHPMADGVWRLDYQMPEGADPEVVSRPEVAAERIRAQLGAEVDFEFVWIGPYQYRDLLLDRFRHGRLLFIGDSAHVVSPFGARGGNSGIQDANNLGWKLAWVLRGWADESLIDSYHVERHAAAVENLTVARRTARFLSPRSPAEHRLRRAALALAREHPFARTLVNAGRMSVANAYPPHPREPEGACTVQNMTLRRADGSTTTVARLLAEADARYLLFEFGAHAPKLLVHARCFRVGEAARPGIDFVDAEGKLAAHLGVTPHKPWALVRPDGYRALG